MATYHGMTFIQCSGCGHTESDDFLMTVWNDQLLQCPNCEKCSDIIWGDTDGNKWQKVGEARFRI
jgi:hypothetical protein